MTTAHRERGEAHPGDDRAGGGRGPIFPRHGRGLWPAHERGAARLHARAAGGPAARGRDDGLPVAARGRGAGRPQAGLGRGAEGLRRPRPRRGPADERRAGGASGRGEALGADGYDGVVEGEVG